MVANHRFQHHPVRIVRYYIVSAVSDLFFSREKPISSAKHISFAALRMEVTFANAAHATISDIIDSVLKGMITVTDCQCTKLLVRKNTAPMLDVCSRS